MNQHGSSVRGGVAPYLIAVGAALAAALARGLLDPYVGDQVPYITFFPAVILASIVGGVGPGLVAAAMGLVFSAYFFVDPRGSFAVASVADRVGLVMYCLVSSAIVAFGGVVWKAQRRSRHAQAQSEAQRELLRVTLGSIADAVISTDNAGQVTTFNAVAEALTGWTRSEAVGRRLEEVFQIVNRHSGEPVQNPVVMVLADGKPASLASHAVLIARDGSRRPIDDSAAPIHSSDGKTLGVVLIFRDVTERSRGEQLLQESNARKTAMFRAAIDAVISMDHEGRVLEVNPACEQIFGYAGAAMVGRTVAELIVPETLRGLHTQSLKRYLATGEARVLDQRLELPALRADGSEIPIELTVTRIKTPGPPMFTAYIRDITERRKTEAVLTQSLQALREGEAKYRTIFDGAAVSLWEEDFAGALAVIERLRAEGVTDFRRHFTENPAVVQEALGAVHVHDVNAATLRMFEADDKAQILGSLPEIFVPESLPVFVDELVTLAEGRDYLEAEALLRTVKGNPVHVLFTMRAAPTPEVPSRVLFSVIDISTRKRVEHELQKAARDLAESDRRKTDFLALLAHELRNPLVPIRNALAILRMTPGDGRATLSAVEMMERQVAQVARLIDDLLDINRINRGKLELRKERVDLKLLVTQAIEVALPSFSSLDHELTVSQPPQTVHVNADPTRFSQLFGNLLNNACKFTQRGGHIHVAIELEPEIAVIRVRDNGVGIPAAQLPRIFEMFAQVESTGGLPHDGLGIGLSLVKKLVEMHGGSVEARSEGVGRGTEIVVRLPVAGEPATPPVATGGKVEVKTRRRILVVDDNRDSAESLTLLLKLNGHEAHSAHDGLEAVEAAAAIQPDIILLDIGLPKLNGYDAARRIREQQGGERIVLVAMTGWGQAEDRRRSQEAGFNLHLVKPVNPQALMKTLGELGAS